MYLCSCYDTKVMAVITFKANKWPFSKGQAYRVIFYILLSNSLYQGKSWQPETRHVCGVDGVMDYNATGHVNL